MYYTVTWNKNNDSFGCVVNLTEVYIFSIMILSFELKVYFGFIECICLRCLTSVSFCISGLPSIEEDPELGKESLILTGSPVPDETPLGTPLPDESSLGTLDPQSDILSMKESLPEDIPACILKCKSVFKCRLCPRVVCLNEETLKAHLKSKVCLTFFFLDCGVYNVFNI